MVFGHCCTSDPLPVSICSPKSFAGGLAIRTIDLMKLQAALHIPTKLNLVVADQIDCLLFSINARRLRPLQAQAVAKI
jgi:hypothetical protein